jgi:hypothetical protein
VQRALLIGSVLAGSWLGMQTIHEFGHVLGAWLTGGQITKVVVHPLTISRTDLAENPHPLVVVWAGPLLGVLLPLVAWATTSALRMPGAFVLRFFAGFCAIANGGYIGAGSFIAAGDCGVMLHHGSPIWLLWLFGAATLPLGLLLWHGQGKRFGLGPHADEVKPAIVCTCLAICGALILLGAALGGEQRIGH